MSPQLEKVFLNYLMDNKKYLDIVKPHFFKNKEIQFVYNVIRNFLTSDVDISKPTPRQILDMISLEDREGMITKDILKSILNINLKEYDERNFIIPKFNTWVLINRIRTGTVDLIEETRNLDDISDFESTLDIAGKIRELVDDMSSTKFIKDEEDLGSDFDDENNHIQDSEQFRVRSGFETVDHMLGGGWDVATLNILMAQTNGGKCSHYNTKIRIKNKENGISKDIKIGDFFKEIKNSK